MLDMNLAQPFHGESSVLGNKMAWYVYRCMQQLDFLINENISTFGKAVVNESGNSKTISC